MDVVYDTINNNNFSELRVMSEPLYELEKQLSALAPTIKMVNLKHAAMLLGYSESHLRRLNLYPMAGNILPRVVMGNGRVMYLVEDLKRFLKRRVELHGR